MARKFFIFYFLMLQALWAFAADASWTYIGRRNHGVLVLNMGTNEIYIQDRALSAQFEFGESFVGVFSSYLSFCVPLKNLEKWSCGGVVHKVVGYEDFHGESVRVVEVSLASKIYLYLSITRGVVAFSEDVSQFGERMEVLDGCGYPYVDDPDVGGASSCRMLGDSTGRTVILLPNRDEGLR